MKSNNKKTGMRGEDLATEFLENKNYLIVERNFRTRFGEIDIVCLDGEILVFVEVKTKIGHDFGEPEEMVNKSKLAQVQRMGEVFIEMNNFVICDSDQNRHCEFPRSGTEAIPTKIDFAQSSEIATVRSTETLPAGWQVANDGKGGTSLMDSCFRGNDKVWNGRCRVDVVGIVLNEDLSVERIRHFEAVY